MVGTPMAPARSCRGWLMSNTDAMASPTPEARRRYKPILPIRVFTCGQAAKASAQLLSAQAPNINERTHPYFPFAYSLTTRHEGSNSGLRTCRLASSRMVATANPAAIRAAGVETLDLIPFILEFSWPWGRGRLPADSGAKARTRP